MKEIVKIFKRFFITFLVCLPILIPLGFLLQGKMQNWIMIFMFVTIAGFAFLIEEICYSKYKVNKQFKREKALLKREQLKRQFDENKNKTNLKNDNSKSNNKDENKSINNKKTNDKSKKKKRVSNDSKKDNVVVDNVLSSDNNIENNNDNSDIINDDNNKAIIKKEDQEKPKQKTKINKKDKNGKSKESN